MNTKVHGPAGPNSFAMDLAPSAVLFKRLEDEEDAALEAYIDSRRPVTPQLNLPLDAAARKALPVFTGFVKYFPLAIAAVTELSMKGNDQHNPGKPLHWDRSKSGDEKDALTRHLLDAGTFDIDGVRHSTKVAWRAMANLQKELEQS